MTLGEITLLIWSKFAWYDRDESGLLPPRGLRRLNTCQLTDTAMMFKLGMEILQFFKAESDSY